MSEVQSRRPDRCPCGSGAAYSECCEPLHQGEPAPAAVGLMRARYAAFALGLPDYLAGSWHSGTRPADLRLDPELTWRRLQIVDTARGGAGDDEGMVEFRAVYRSPTGLEVLHERSRFVREHGSWVYLDGDLLED
nr:YchJ family metal-binding protein [Naasia sp.]